MKKTDNNVSLWNLNLFGSSKHRLLEKLTSHLIEGQKTLFVFTPNPEQVVLSQQNNRFLKVLQKADLLIPDGQGLVWVSRLLSLRGKTESIQERIPGREVVAELLKFATENELKILVVGGRNYDQGIKESSLIDSRVIWSKGYEDVVNPSCEEEMRIKDIISKQKPALVLVAFGAPHQELWAIEHQDLLQKNKVKVVMVVGGAMDYLLGKVAQTPRFVSQLGLEWLFRLISQPWRWRRQLKLINFMGMMIKQVTLRPRD